MPKINKNFIIIIILSFFILIFLNNCKNKINNKNYQNESYISLNNNFYYKISPQAINNYYYSISGKMQWTKFNYEINDFAKIKIYFMTEKKNRDIIDQINKNLSFEIKNYYKFNYQKFRNETIYNFKILNHIAFISHNDKKMGFQPLKEGWDKGYSWDTINAFTDLNIFFTHKNFLVYYNLIIEYLPGAEKEEEASLKFYEFQDKILNIINNLYQLNELNE